MATAGKTSVVAFQVAISISAVVGGYVVDSYGAAGPLLLTPDLATSMVAWHCCSPEIDVCV